MELVVTPGGWLDCEGRRLRCALGRGGIRADKREGDGATPAGVFPLRFLLYRSDRLARPPTPLPALPIGRDDGWCDDPADPVHYNRPVRLPHPSRCERLARADGVYDVLAVIGYNDAPPVPGLGSAIFMHVARPDFAPTEGCVALPLPDLLAVLRRCPEGTPVRIVA